MKGMQRNHHLAQAVGDASFGTFLTLLEYKCRWYGVNLIKIDRFAPSSKTCSQCGYSRKDNLHKITYALTHESQVRTLCMEHLNVKGMQRNHHLAQAVGDASFGTFLTLLEYKCRWYGVNLIKIDRFAPSSKTCSQCGYIYKGLKLSERSWTCPECGTHHDRDFNAACNIKEFGLKALPTERGKVKPVDCPTVDDRPRVLKSRDRKKQEKRGGIGISEAAKYLV